MAVEQELCDVIQTLCWCHYLYVSWPLRCIVYFKTVKPEFLPSLTYGQKSIRSVPTSWWGQTFLVFPPVSQVAFRITYQTQTWWKLNKYCWWDEQASCRRVGKKKKKYHGMKLWWEIKTFADSWGWRNDDYMWLKGKWSKIINREWRNCMKLSLEHVFSLL